MSDNTSKGYGIYRVSVHMCSSCGGFGYVFPWRTCVTCFGAGVRKTRIRLTAG